MLGPYGGDVRSLTYDPRNPARILLGTGTGTIFVSTDGGYTWTRFAHLGTGNDYVIDHIVIDPTHPNVMLVSAWSVQDEKAGDLFRSTDSGATWQALSAMRGKSIRALAIAGSDSDVIVVGCLDGIYRSKDGGTTWEQMSPVSYPGIKNIESLAIDPKNIDTVYAGTWHLAWKTTDGGRSWHQLNRGMIDDSDVFSILIDSTNSSTVFASACSGIYKSDNAGELFRKIQGIPFSARRTRVLKQDPGNPSVIYAGTTEGLWRTSDGGKTWKLVGNPDAVVNDILIDPRDTRHILLATDRSGILMSEDDARTFKTANRGYTHRLVTALLVDSTDPDVVYVAVANDREYGGVFFLRQSTGSWQQASMGLGGRDVYTLVQSRDGALFAGTNHGIFMWDRDSNTWRVTARIFNSPQPLLREVALGEYPHSSEMGRGVEPLVDEKVNEINATSAHWLAATSGGLLTSSDEGRTWTGGPVLGRQDFVSVYSSGNLRVAATHTELLISNGSKDWRVSPLPSHINGIHQVVITPDGVVLMASRAGLFRSSDAGATWETPAYGVANKDINSISYDDEHHRLLATIKGTGVILESTDRGRTWHQQADAGYPLRNVRVLRGHLMGATLFDGVAVQP